VASKLLQLVTTSRSFAALYIVIFLCAIIGSMFSKGDSLWVKTAWSMLALLGLFVTLGGVMSIKLAFGSRQWPKTTARLIRSWLAEYRTYGSSLVYSPMVEYEYEVIGKSYSGDCIDYSSQSGSKRWAQKVLDEVGTNHDYIQIHYSPDDHAISVIRPGFRFIHFLRLFIGFVMILVGIVAAIGVENILSGILPNIQLTKGVADL